MSEFYFIRVFISFNLWNVYSDISENIIKLILNLNCDIWWMLFGLVW